MKIDKRSVYKVANLARIAINDNEVDTLTIEMNKILTFMEKLNELDTTAVKPLVYMQEDVNVWREDRVENELATAEGLKNAAQHDEQFFLVPKILASSTTDSKGEENHLRD